MKLPKIAAACLLFVFVIVAAAGCGGGNSSTSTKIFSLGTVNVIDSLNPFVLTEPQAFTVANLVYPQLLTYGGKDGTALQGDWASSWNSSNAGRTWTFHLRPGKWSDGKPLTSADAVWTIKTEMRYANGGSALVASALAGVNAVSAPDAHTLRISYSRPVGNALAQLSTVWILPAHVWRSQTGNHGLDLKAYNVANNLPMVAGGPYTVTQYAEKGTTVLRANPNFYGPKPAAKAVAITYYTNPVSMLAALRSGDLSAVDQVPSDTVGIVRKMSGVKAPSSPDWTVIPILFNSNPAKPRNRELLDPRVREAIDLGVSRSQLIDVPFRGQARAWANWVAPYSGSWVDPSIKPPAYDPQKANQILDALGYKRGSNGVRVVPATTGKYAQPAHQMSYPFAVPGDLAFDGSRAEQVIARDLAKIGIAIHEVDTGDTAASYTYYSGPNGKYTNYDMGIWYYIGYVDPTYILQFPTKAQWDNYSDTGYANPAYDRLFDLQSRMVNQQARKAVVWKMERIIDRDKPYLPLLATGGTMAYTTVWTGVNPNVYGYKGFFEQARPAS